jgi:hypothetical protein
MTGKVYGGFHTAPAAERRGNNSQKLRDFYLKDKARI